MTQNNKEAFAKVLENTINAYYDAHATVKADIRPAVIVTVLAKFDMAVHDVIENRFAEHAIFLVEHDGDVNRYYVA